MEQLLEIIGTIVGLLYIWLEYRASIYLWIVGIIMPAIYIFIYYDAGLYADFGINIYYLLAAVYGWCVWKFNKKEGKSENTLQNTKEELPITHTPIRTTPYLLATFCVTFAIIAWILIRYTDSNVPYLDSFTTALSIVAMWMLAKKYVEQWWAWTVVDVVCVGLYIYKDLYFTACLYALYTVIAVFGYKQWLRLMRKTEEFNKESL